MPDLLRYDAGPALVPDLLRYDADAGLLVTRYLPGRIATGTPAAGDPDAYRQAGRMLALLHCGPTSSPRDKGRYETTMLRKCRSWLDRAEGPSAGRPLAPAPHLAAARKWLDGFVPAPVELVPTHGDFQPRNWIVDATGTLGLIDFGRAELRPWYTDLVRLEHQEFLADPDLAPALFEGYGRPDGPFTPGRWLDHLGQSLGTVVWSHDMGDEGFEEHGRRMLARTVEALASPRTHRRPG
ncbi:aminoglycoside phosphotransferase family protein [Zafaria sp. Z1313]|uniref:aminoglycoside phosphotransferase family protein n=1 Tax=Zafaria sp. Z1313 TaxID=3423202 RepID=UPI003D3036B1